MTVDTQPISTLLVQTTQEHASHYAYPDSLQPQIVLPISKKLSKITLSFFSNPKQRLKFAIKWFLSGLIKTRKGLFYKESELMEQFKRDIDQPDTVPAISLGTPGPYNKQTVLLLNKTGKPVSITKISTNKHTEQLLKNESNWLEKIKTNVALSNSSPSLVHTSTIDSIYFLTQSIGTGTASPVTLIDKHIQFLSQLQEIDDTRLCFENCQMHNLMTGRVKYLEHKISDQHFHLLKNALKSLESDLQNSGLTMVSAHRDFVPWNIKWRRDGIFVYDWEYASEEYIPLYDIFHFLIMPVVVKRRLTNKDIDFFCSQAEHLGADLNNGHKKTQYSKIQLLAYLLDICLFYLESNDGNSKGDNVVNRYELLIKELTGNR